MIIYHVVCPAKYRRAVITEEADRKLKEICLEIEKRYETKFRETGTEEDPARFEEHSARSGEHSARSGEYSARSGEHSARSGEHSARSGAYAARSEAYAARSEESIIYRI
jgi:TFIIF-interacting CTD phosphatase-like protein